MKDFIRLILFFVMVVLIGLIILFGLVLAERVSIFSLLETGLIIGAIFVFYVLLVYRPQFFSERKRARRQAVSGFRIVSGRDATEKETPRLFVLPQKAKQETPFVPLPRPKLFGTAGIRGLINIEITPLLTLKICQVFGDQLGSGVVALGYDTRYGAKMLAQAAATGLTSAGISVIDCGCIPIGGLAAYIVKHKLAGGVIITGSHMPYDMTGIIMLGSDGTCLPEAVTGELEERFYNYEKRQQGLAPESIGPYQIAENPLGLYKDFLLGLVDGVLIRSKKYKVLVDPGNGTAALVLPDILKGLGCEVRLINDKLQPIPSRSPEPRAHNLGAAQNEVKEHNCDIGVATDIDADRVLFIDHSGKVLSEDLVGAIFARAIFEASRPLGRGSPGTTPGGVPPRGSAADQKVCVTPINSSGLIEQVCAQAKARLEYCCIGHPATLKVIKNFKANFSYEESGKYYFAGHPAHSLYSLRTTRDRLCAGWPDGILAALKLLEIMARQDKSLKELADRFPPFYQVKHTVLCKSGYQERVMKEVRVVWEKEGLSGRKRDVTIDGLKRIYQDGAWLLIRKSGTEPLIRVYSDAKSMARAEELVQLGEGIVHRAMSAAGRKAIS